MIKRLIFLYCFLIAVSICQIDSTKIKMPDFSGYSKKIEIKGLIPKTYDDVMRSTHIPSYHIEEIKQKALEFESEPANNNEIVIMETSRGVIKLKLFPDLAPKHCNNFKKLANSGFYDGTTFHRVIPNFMVQGGDILSRDANRSNDGTGSPGWTVDAEFNETDHKRGILSMARSAGLPNSAGSQFFICVADAPHLNGEYTAFGDVIENMHIVDKIVHSETDYSQAMRLCQTTIPEGEDPKDWVKLNDPKSRKVLFSKVPDGEPQASYKSMLRKKLRSDNPIQGVVINSVRVINKKGNEIREILESKN